MKKIQREVTTYKDIFVSVDGKEFNNEADCRNWENSYKGTLKASWDLIEKVEANTPKLGLPYSSDDQECYIIKPKTLEEIVLINAYIESSTGDEGRLTTKHIDVWVALNFGYDHEYCDIYTLADHLEHISKYISELSNKTARVESNVV